MILKEYLKVLRSGLANDTEPPELDRESGYLKRNLAFIWPFIKQYKFQGIMAGSILIISNLIALPTPLISRHIIDSGILGANITAVLAGAVLLIMFALAGYGARMIQQFLFTRYEQNVIRSIQDDLTGKVLHFPKQFFDSQSTGYLISRLTADVHGLSWFFSRTIAQIVSNVLRICVGIAMVFYLEWRLALVIIFTLPLAVIVVRRYSGIMRSMGHKVREQNARFSGTIFEAISNVSLIKSFAVEDRTQQKVSEEFQKSQIYGLEQGTVSQYANVVLGFYPAITRNIAFLLGAWLIIKYGWTLGSLYAFLGYLSMVTGPIQFFGSAGYQMNHSLAALDRVAALYRIVPEKIDGKIPQSQRLLGDIEFRGVDFSYGSQAGILSGLSFKISSGERVAIAGASGVGKTTLVSLLMRFYSQNSGEILFDGESIQSLDVKWLRRRIGYVSQDPVICSGTVMDNLRYGNPDALKSDVESAVHKAGLQEVINSLPLKYEASLGEKGVKLSVGQRQRLSLARALISQPDILILDEPTAALDSALETQIFKGLQGFHGSIIIIAHRLSTVNRADRVLFLESGAIKDQGIHAELMNRNEIYKELFAGQIIEH